MGGRTYRVHKIDGTVLPKAEISNPVRTHSRVRHVSVVDRTHTSCPFNSVHTIMANPNASDALSNLITTYHSLNAAVVDILHEEPSPLEFMQYVARNRPFVVRGGAANWAAIENWNADYLTETMDGEQVKVAVTPEGYVLSPTKQNETKLTKSSSTEMQMPL